MGERRSNNYSSRSNYSSNNSSSNGLNSAKSLRNIFAQRGRSCPLSGSEAPEIDYKNIKLLRRFTTESGKIIPSRISSISAKKQRELAKAVKRARILALVAFADR